MPALVRPDRAQVEWRIKKKDYNLIIL